LHFDDAQMVDLMREIVNRLFTFHLRRDDPSFRDHLDRWMTASDRWDNPTLDTAFSGRSGRAGVRPEGVMV